MRNKILIISHLALNKTNNVGKTLFEFFKHFKKSEIAQLFFTDILPDDDYCSEWYKVTDLDMLKSLKRKNKAGVEYFYKDEKNDVTNNFFYKKSVGRSTIKLLLRDLIWKIGSIDWVELDAWIQRIQPTVIFVAPGYNSFAYDIALKIAQKHTLPLCTYIMDDYYFDRKNFLNPLEYFRIGILRSKIKKLLFHSKHIFFVSEALQSAYNFLLNNNSSIIYTPYDSLEEPLKFDEHNEIKLFYAGSLGVGRWKILLEIARAISCIQGAHLDIYASKREEKLIKKVMKETNVNYCGFLPQDRLKEEMRKYDFVVHTESFERKNRVKTRYSISTKVPELLSSGIPIFAVGPKKQASIEYLKKNDSAFICSSIKDIQKNIIIALKNKELQAEILKNAQILCKKNHDSYKIYEQLYNCFSSLEGD
ncbi:MAG: hypothetical protein K5765_04555 [Clostridia bacterium]|nr:hypothetical protein [Clostridia bacterium]